MNRKTDRAKLVMDLCDRLVGLADDERNALLEKACADRPGLRRDVEELLESIDSSGQFMALDVPESET